LRQDKLFRRALTEAALIFVAALLFFRWKLGQWDGFLDFDGHYHLKVAQWITHSGFWTDIPWLPFTALGERGPDHQWLWHVMLLPATLLSDPGEALAWAAACNGAATAGVIAFVMRMLGVPAAPIFALLAISAGFSMPYRLMMLRAQNIAIIFMMLSLWAMARGRYKTLALLAFLFLQSYHAAVILLPIALIGSAVGSLWQRRVVSAPLTAVSAGEVLALLLSPWFPRNIEFLMFHTLYKTATPVHDSKLSSLIGTEWYPQSWMQVWLDSWPAHVMFAAALAALAWCWWRRREFRPGADTVIALGVAAMLLAMCSYAVRFAEYYIPFAALAAGLAARDCWMPVRFPALRIAILVAWLYAASAPGLAATNPSLLMRADHLERVGQRLNELGRGGEIVFNSSWTDFMALVWWADRFRYVNGLDGHFLAYQDPDRLAIWLTLGSGRMEDAAQVIDAVFGARYAVVARQHGKLAEQLLKSKQAVLHVDSPEGWLFEIKSANAGAPGGKRLPPPR